MPIVNRISAYHDDMREWRRDIHKHPELAYNEHRTASKVAELLKTFGVDEIVEGIGGTGLVGVIRNGEGRSIGLRADMDALPITEDTGVPYSSVNEGVMHACGHDGHTTMLLGAAKYLAETKNFSGTVVLIFQPAEEGYAGARAMMDDGLFDRFPVDEIYGVHNMPGVAQGEITVSPGPVMAAADSFLVTVKGSGGHGAMPHLAIDPVVAAATMVSSIQSLVSRAANPHDTLVISVTKINGGDAFNVIPDAVTFGGTVRYFDQDLGKKNLERMTKMIEGVAAGHGVTVEIKYDRGYPPTSNHEKQAGFARDIAVDVTGIKAKRQPQVMGSEDFSFYLQDKPGAYAWIGNGDNSESAQLHNPHYNFNDEILPVGASFFVRLAETALTKNAT